MTISKPRSEAPAWMSGGYQHKDLKFETAVIRERVSTLTEMQVEFISKRQRLDLKTMVGQLLTVHVAVDGSEGNGRMFTGTCVSVEALDSEEGDDKYFAEVRPWFWMLTLTHENRVFQNKDVKQIIEEVIQDYGQSSFLELKCSGNYNKREFCVQYRESDFDFLSRLMEEEGLFYYFDHSDAFNKNEKLVICDANSGFADLQGNNEIHYRGGSGGGGARIGTMMGWSECDAIVRGKVSLGDYDFEKPQKDQQEKAIKEIGEHQHKKYEFYDLPGHYRSDEALGKKFAEIRLTADSAKQKEFEGIGTDRHMAAGHTFKLLEHPIDALNKEYAVIGAVHHVYDPRDFKGEKSRSKLPSFSGDIAEDYSFKIIAIDKQSEFRAPLVTPWPRVPGVQTGVVVGPAGKEIHTDQHGRVLVHFRWDRVNERNENASCFIRVATGWSGKDWGLNSVPRIGQEVLIQFEDGDPDRPIVTGMLYNADTMPPYVDPSQPTRTGLMTRSSPKGGADDYNALVFEDKAGAEYTHFQSQKDYQMVVKDSAEIIIGDASVNVDTAKQTVAAGSLQQTVKQNVTEMVELGDKTETVDKGNLELTVEGNVDETVRTGNKTETIKTGNLTQKVSTGNLTQKVSTGNMKVDVSSGKIDISAATTITMEANQTITLKVGGSSIVINQAGVTIKGAISAKMEAAMVTSQASGILTLSGSLTKIN